MLGLTSIGIIHTAISLVAVGAGFYSLARHGAIAWRHTAGRTYVLATALTCLTALFIFQHGGFNKAHVLGIFTLLVLAVAWGAEMRPGLPAARYIATLGYSFTLLLHMIPAFTETATRLPPGAPLVSGPDDPRLLPAFGVAFLVFLAGAVLQFRHLRAGRSSRHRGPLPEAR
ncbi:hypothetical protein D0B54_01990 [Solimonas sp. K1W22B-7]|uniref:hypothetical protein n=1 Tax=Solimonas sp. K1W22B-7 TaxID=2303331 RepID=UPI000E333941|nr:hypothetical protein [Solimonas sp. K1W22B-7]AXQ27525.1 hypothetical protein D0B54_01990 [Solimonas sp. K1W22B-7]